MNFLISLAAKLLKILRRALEDLREIRCFVENVARFVGNLMSQTI